MSIERNFEEHTFESGEVRAKREDEETIQSLEAFTKVIRECDESINKIDDILLGNINNKKIICGRLIRQVVSTTRGTKWLRKLIY